MKKVQEIINEEQSFEIIDLPEPAVNTPTKAKSGHRKVQCIFGYVVVVVIAVVVVAVNYCCCYCCCCIVAVVVVL